MANPQVMQRGVKLAIKAIGFHNQPNAVEVTQSDGKQRCVICPRAVDRKTRTRCSECRNVCCQDHSSIVCDMCDICHDNDWLHGIGRLVEVLLRTNKPPYIENTYIGFYSVHCSVVSFIVYVVSFMRQENSFCKKTLYPSIPVELYLLVTIERKLWNDDKQTWNCEGIILLEKTSTKRPVFLFCMH
jgi:hypothetical protein